MSGVGSVVIPDSLIQSVKELHEFLFPDLEYEVSSTVKAIDEKIQNKSLDRSEGSDFTEDEVNFYSEPQYYEYGGTEQDTWTGGGETQTPDYGTGDQSGNTGGSGNGESSVPGGDGTLPPDGGGSDLGSGDAGSGVGGDSGGETGGADTGTGQEVTE